jgi:hypothetical protein
MDSIDLPQTAQGKYDIIKNAVMLYNNRFRTSITCDDLTESLNIALTEDQLLIVGQYMRITCLRNNLTYKNSIFNTFTKEIGVKFIDAQVNKLENEIKDCNNMIDFISFNSSEYDIMGG